jgi:vacuolar protein sorting-associated protein 13A/C
MSRTVFIDGSIMLLTSVRTQCLHIIWFANISLDLPGSDNVVLLTNTRVLSIWSKKLRLDWELPFTQVQGVNVEDTGVRFTHKAGKAYDKFILIPDKSSHSWFFGQVAHVVKSFNARKRMDT